MSVINTNITALIGQQNLNRSASALQTSMERLSSGLRINSAKDDAAGQAIANRMSSQISGLQQAQRNANDGISMSQTAEGALNKINDNLQRIRELTVQAENGTNSDSDLESIQSEISQRLEEINRVSEETSFNGTKVLDETRGLKIQVGAYDGESITINLRQINQSTLGLTGFNVDGSGKTPNAAASAADLAVAGFDAADNGTPNANGSVTYTKDTITNNNQMTSNDLMAKLDNGATIDLHSTSSTGFTDGSGAVDYDDVTLTYNAANDNFTFDVAGATASSVSSQLAPGAGEGPRAATINYGGTTTDILINEDGSIVNANNEELFIDAEGNLTTTTNSDDETYANATVENLTALMTGQNILAADGTTTLAAGTDINTGEIGTAKIQLTDSDTSFEGTGTAINVEGAVVSKDTVASMLSAQGGNVVLAAGISVTDDEDISQTASDFEVDADGLVTSGDTYGDLEDGNAIFVDAEGNLSEATTTTTTTTYYAHADGGVTDNTGAKVYVDGDGEFTFEAETAGTATENPLAALDDALKQVDSLRSDLGALQNRFESAIDNLSTTSTNLSAARSRIEDADYAVEVGNMTRAQILQQAGTSVLAQANQVPQTVLSLLR